MNRTAYCVYCKKEISYDSKKHQFALDYRTGEIYVYICEVGL